MTDDLQEGNDRKTVRRFSYSESTLPGGARQISLTGYLDSGIAMNRGDEIHDLVTDEGGVVLLDLSELLFLASSGIRVLVRCGRDLREVGGELHLAAAQPSVMSVLTIAGLVPLFPFYKTLDEAHQALQSSAE